MRILNLDGTYFVHYLKKAGHEVLSIGFGQECDLTVDRCWSPKRLLDFLNAQNFVPDLVLWNDLCKPPSVLGFELLPCVCIGFSIDQYCNPWHVPFSAGFDLFLVAQKDYLELFELLPLKREVAWLPLFFDPRFAFVSKDQKRDIPISFVGTLDGVYNRERRPFLLACKKQLPLFLYQGNYQPVYSRSKLVLNQSAAGELNFRIFEAAACGAAVLTEDTSNGLRELFVVGEEILVYTRGDVKDAVGKAKAALNSSRLKEIALAGQTKVEKEHSVHQRVSFILNKTQKLLREKAYQARLAQKKLVLEELAKTFHFLSLDEQLNLPLDLKAKYMDLAKAYLQACNLV